MTLSRSEYAELGDDDFEDFETPPMLSDEARARLASPDTPKLRINPDNLYPIDWNEDPS